MMVRNARFRKVQLAAGDRYDLLAQLDAAAAALTDPPERPSMTAAAWDDALGSYWEEHDAIGAGPQARGPQLLIVDRHAADAGGRRWTVRRIIDEPRGGHDFAIVAAVDLDASDAAGEPGIRTTSVAAAGVAS